MDKPIMEMLLSGLAGALIAQVLTIAWSEINRRREYRALLNGIIAECDYNLSIVDEILGYVINNDGTFKRMSVDYFRTVRESAAKYSVDTDLIRTLSRAIVDLELYNLEADYIFNGSESKIVYAGAIDEKPILVERKPDGTDITATMKRARLGVTNTLNDLKKLANKALYGEEE